MKEMLKRLQDRHIECEPVAKKAIVQAAAVVSPDVPNVLQEMMHLEQAKTRTKSVKQLLQTKRDRTPDYRREGTHIQNHHSTPLVSHAEVPTPQEDMTDPLDHSRLGLVGWISARNSLSGRTSSSPCFRVKV